MLVSIHQPDYLPWLGYFNKMAAADIFVFLDTATYSRNGFHNRNKIKTPNGWMYLTIPVERKYCFSPMNEIPLPVNKKWAGEHYRSLLSNYAKAAYWKEYKDFFEDLYSLPENKFSTLAEFNIHVIAFLAENFGLTCKLQKATDLSISKDKKAGEALIEILQVVHASAYLSGPSGKKYLELEKFTEAGITVTFQEFIEKPHKQLFDEFVPGLSALDLLFNYGPESGQYLS